MGTLTGSIIGNWVSNAFYGILLTIDYVIYLAINICYQLFEVVSKVEVFSTENVGVISRRIYTIIGIVMLFVFAYNIILAIVDPDSLSKGEKSVKNIVQNTIISIVLVTLFPLICEYMQIFQNHIIENNTIGNLIMGSTASDSGENGQTKGALNVSVTIFTAFYHPIDENKEPVTLTECESSSVKLCSRYKEMADNAKNGIGGLWNFMHDEDLKDGIYDDDMEYLFPLSTIAGVVAAYLFLSFSLDLGVRAAKLGALKLIAPIPIFLRITKPKGGQFDKWFSEFTKTYLQVFERIVIINFAMLLISFVSDINIFASGGGIFINVIATVVVILGILKFAKDAPKLLEEIFSVKIPQMSIKKKLNENEYALRGASVLGAAGTTAVGNVIKGIGAGKSVGQVIKTGFGGLIGGGRQGWVQSRGLNDITKVKDTIVGARSTADEHRDDREAHNRQLENKWIEEHGEEYTNTLRTLHPEWSEEQIKKAVAEKAKEYSTVFDRMTDNIADAASTFADYLTDGSNSVLQRSVDNQTKLKNTVGSFLKNVANKGSYNNIKKGRDDLITDSYQGKLTSAELASRLASVSGKRVVQSGNSITVGDKTYNFGTANDREKTIKAVYKDLLSAEQAKSLEKLGQDGCINYAQTLSKQFEQVAFTIDDPEQRDKLSGMVNDLVTQAKSENINYAQFAKQYEDLETALNNSIAKSQSGLASEQAKKDGK
ncbi:unknown [Clostridium sp. CAG:533]|nr:unknown [Clostridium sp. CAG:533]